MEASPGVALLVGAGTLVGGILVGKAVVDLAQGDEARPGAMDESVRFVGSMIGLTLAVVQIPRAYEAAQAIMYKSSALV